MNDQGVLGVLAGVGTARAAASIMALGLDPRFDCRKAYWLIAGIAGADPVDASLGSAVWSEWVVDGDLAYEVDSREIPPQWTTGYVPLGKTEPYPATTRRLIQPPSFISIQPCGSGRTSKRSRAPRRFPSHGHCARAMRRGQCPAPALRVERRHPGRFHFLARKNTRSMGQATGSVITPRPGVTSSPPQWKTAAFCSPSLFSLMPSASTLTVSWRCAPSASYDQAAQGEDGRAKPRGQLRPPLQCLPPSA